MSKQNQSFNYHDQSKTQYELDKADASAESSEDYDCGEPNQAQIAQPHSALPSNKIQMHSQASAA